MIYFKAGIASETHQVDAEAAAVPDVPAECGPADSVGGQDAIATEGPGGNEKVSQGLRDGAPRSLVHAVQVEEGMHPVRRLGFGSGRPKTSGPKTRCPALRPDVVWALPIRVSSDQSAKLRI